MHFWSVHGSCALIGWQNKGQSGNKFLISAHANGGPHSRVCARKTLCSALHQRERKCFGAHVCTVDSKHLPQPIKSHIQSFRTLGKFSNPLVHPKSAYFNWNPNIFAVKSGHLTLSFTATLSPKYPMVWWPFSGCIALISSPEDILVTDYRQQNNWFSCT